MKQFIVFNVAIRTDPWSILPMRKVQQTDGSGIRSWDSKGLDDSIRGSPLKLGEEIKKFLWLRSWTDPRSIVGKRTATPVWPAMDLGSGKFNLWLKNKIQPVVEASSNKLQAASNKLLDNSSGII